MENKRGTAYAEVYDIVKHSDISIQEKISSKFMSIIENNMDKSYNVMIDYTKELEEPNILRETKVILGIIYRDYLCSPEEKQELIKNENELLRRIEEEREAKYSVDNLFRNTKYAKTPEVNRDIMVIKKGKWYKKIWNGIMKLFGK